IRLLHNRWSPDDISIMQPGAIVNRRIDELSERREIRFARFLQSSSRISVSLRIISDLRLGYHADGAQPKIHHLARVLRPHAEHVRIHGSETLVGGKYGFPGNRTAGYRNGHFVPLMNEAHVEITLQHHR